MIEGQNMSRSNIAGPRATSRSPAGAMQPNLVGITLDVIVSARQHAVRGAARRDHDDPDRLRASVTDPVELGSCQALRGRAATSPASPYSSDDLAGKAA